MAFIVADCGAATCYRAKTQYRWLPLGKIPTPILEFLERTRVIAMDKMREAFTSEAQATFIFPVAYPVAGFEFGFSCGNARQAESAAASMKTAGILLIANGTANVEIVSSNERMIRKNEPPSRGFHGAMDTKQ
jgi:hypothetical protein